MKIKLFGLSFLPIISPYQLGPNFISKSLLQQGEKTHIQKAVSPSFKNTHTIKKHQNFYESLKEVGFKSSDIYDIVRLIKPHFNFSRINPGYQYEVQKYPYPLKVPVKISFPQGPLKTIVLTEGEKGFSKEVIKKEYKIKRVSFQGTVKSSLWNSAVSSGLNPPMIDKLTNIFAWEIDFGREVRPGDSWKFVIEQKVIGNKIIGHGNILVAEYINRGRSYKAVRFPQKGKNGEFFGPNGGSLKNKFLKSPIRFGRITSRFSYRRFHPILKIKRPHLGVDYGAPRGTPVMSVGDGRVVYMRRTRSGGKTVKISHGSVYKTAYLHLHRFARGLHVGQMVKQGDVIGQVGSTGLATGPHLHFEFYERGRFIDPLGKKFPKAKNLSGAKLKTFLAQVKQVLAYLPKDKKEVLLAQKKEDKRQNNL